MSVPVSPLCASRSTISSAHSLHRPIPSSFIRTSCRPLRGGIDGRRIRERARDDRIIRSI
jgi:hypothetical protein